ncbi:hypothetical protein MKX03_003033 [Papaver bracteatum]|nr:hypothetical protein MKX03_003033 [Papaver bracteatum]
MKALKRGQLKAAQWEEVANTIATNCGFDEPSKLSTQCRHKMEKLRKRYRSEKQRPVASNWIYFDLMDQMERGIFPLTVKPISSIPPPAPGQNQSTDDDEEDEVDDDNEDNDGFNNVIRSRSINHILRRPLIEEEEENGIGGDGGLGRRGGELLMELASVIRKFGEGFVKTENMKMEVMRELERTRMEMEAKRTEMRIILN